MGAVSADLPMVLVTSGSRKPATFRPAHRLRQRPVAAVGRAAGRPPRRRGLAGAGTLPGLRHRDLQHDGHGLDHGHHGRDARADDPRLGHDPGRVPAGRAAAVAAGRCAVEAVSSARRPFAIRPRRLANAIRMLHAIGGSTNAMIHLAAIAGGPDTAALDDLAASARASRCWPTWSRPAPGSCRTDRAAGSRRCCGTREPDGISAVTVTGATIGEVAAPLPPRPGRSGRWGFVGEKWGLRRGPRVPGPGRCGDQASAATPALLRHRGPALVFRGYEEMRRRVEDPALDVTPDSAWCWPAAARSGARDAGVGDYPGPGQAGRRRVNQHSPGNPHPDERDQLRHGLLHAAPEAATGGPLALVADGDPVAVDVAAGTLTLDVPEAELARRRARWKPPPSPQLRGWPALYDHVLRRPRVATWISCGPRQGAPPFGGARRRPVLNGQASPRRPRGDTECRGTRIFIHPKRQP